MKEKVRSRRLQEATPDPSGAVTLSSVEPVMHMRIDADPVRPILVELPYYVGLSAAFAKLRVFSQSGLLDVERAPPGAFCNWVAYNRPSATFTPRTATFADFVKTTATASHSKTTATAAR